MAKKTETKKKKAAPTRKDEKEKKTTGRKAAKASPVKKAAKTTAKKKSVSPKKEPAKKKTAPTEKKTEKVTRKKTTKQKTGAGRTAKPHVPKETTSNLRSDTMTVESSKFEMKPPEAISPGPAVSFPPPRELPLGYGDTKLTLLVRDPEWIFAYWEINDRTRLDHGLLRGEHNKTISLRVYDVSEVDFDGTNANRFYDVIINDYAVSWYLRMAEVNRSWCVDLGYYDEKTGEFVGLARSNIVETPSMKVSSNAEEKWMQISQEQYHEILRLSGGLALQDFRGSENIMQTISERLQIRVEQSEGASGAVSSGQSGRKESRGKDFWLTVHTDLIVYGATEPGSTVTIQGKAVPLRKDGTFSLRFSLPDGTRVIPVRAVNYEGDREREIVPKIKKETY